MLASVTSTSVSDGLYVAVITPVAWTRPYAPEQSANVYVTTFATVDSVRQLGGVTLAATADAAACADALESVTNVAPDAVATTSDA